MLSVKQGGIKYHFLSLWYDMIWDWTGPLANTLPARPMSGTLAENETNKYLGILEADTIKQIEMKNRIKKEYLRRTRKLLEIKLNSRNLIKGINTWAVPLVR